MQRDLNAGMVDLSVVGKSVLLNSSLPKPKPNMQHVTFLGEANPASRRRDHHTALVCLCESGTRS